MYKHEHHNKIARLLQSFNSQTLEETSSLFGGGTAIVLLCADNFSEYRESVDVDFMCSSAEGYRKLRSMVYGTDFSPLFSKPVEMVGDVRADQYGVRGRVKIDDSIIRLEFVREVRIDLEPGEMVCGVPTLSKVDLFASKLLANVDRGTDMQSGAKDIIDLAMMQHAWGDIPDDALAKAMQAYGPAVNKAYEQTRQMINKRSVFERYMKHLKIEPEAQDIIISVLGLDFPEFENDYDFT